jgi:hypothetical protein
MAHDEINPVDKTSRIGPIYPTSETQPSETLAKVKKEVKIEDTLAPSEAAALLAMFYSGVPTLPTIGKLENDIKVASSEISLKVLQTWGDNQREIAERIKEEEKTPAGQARKEEERSLREGLDRSIKDFSEAVRRGSPAAKENVSFVAASFMITPVLMGYAPSMDTVSTSMVKTSVIVNTVRDITAHLDEVIPANYKAVLEALAATLFNGLRTEAALRSLAANNKAEATDPKYMAIQLARRALELAKGDALNHFFSNQPRLVAMLKLLILTASLAALYKALLGGMSRAELKGLLDDLKNQRAPTISNDLLNSVLIGIDAQLQLLGDDREKVWNSILSYIESGPDLSKFFDIKDLVKHLYKANQVGGGLFEVP